MKKELKKINLVNLSKNELQKKELNKLLGGENCCICGCNGGSTGDNRDANYGDGASGLSSPEGGYGTGAF
jgi:natural product precursor